MSPAQAELAERLKQAIKVAKLSPGLLAEYSVYYSQHEDEVLRAFGKLEELTDTPDVEAFVKTVLKDNSSTEFFKETLEKTLEEIRHNTAITKRTISHFMIQRVHEYMDPGSTNSSNPNESSFRKEVTKHYGYENARNVPELCMLTGREHDWHDLTAGHIVARARAAQARVDVNIKDINNPRNGIYWSRAVEGAWTAGIFCFASPAPDVFKFTLLDKSYSDKRVQDWPLGKNPLKTCTKNNLGDMTWGHLHATGQLQFLPGIAGRPYRRALCFMAHMALVKSSQQSLVRPDDVDSQADEFDYMSEEGKIEETVAWINDMKIDY